MSARSAHSLRTPLARAKGLGAAKEGIGHWWHQRLTAAALVPLTLWFCFSIAALPGAEFESVRLWLTTPLNAVLSIVTIAVALYHGYLGVQVIVEDYVQTTWARVGLIVGSGFVALLLGAGAMFAVLLVAFKG